MKYSSLVLFVFMTFGIVNSYYGIDLEQEYISKYHQCNVLGIDLGMTNSCAAVWNNGQVDIIKDQKGNSIIPSIVSFFGEKILAGKKAKSISQNQESTTIYDVKRIIGKKYSEFDSHYSKKDLSYQILDQNQRPCIKIKSNNSSKTLTPQKVSSIILEQIKRIAQQSANKDFLNVIITVPAYFNNQQRYATKQAAKLAGLNVIRILNQPTAAAIAYGLDNRYDQKIIVIDLGLKTFDISILQILDGVFENVANNGDVEFGGYKFNQILIDHFTNMFKIKFNKDISQDTQAIIKLQKQIQKAKLELCVLNQTTIKIKNIIEGYDFYQTLTRNLFEQMNIDLFNYILNQTNIVLHKSNIRKQQINHVILVGNHTRIPKIKQIFKQLFNNSEFHFGINPDQIKCYGAAKQEKLLCNQNQQYNQLMTLIDVTAKPIGVQVEGFIMQVIFPQRTAIPYKKTKTFTTTQDNQTNVTINIYEGQYFLTKYNKIIGVLNLNDIPPRPLGQTQIQVTFQLSYNSNIFVSAVQKESGKSNNITIFSRGEVKINDNQKVNTIRALQKYQQQIQQQQSHQSYLQYSRDQL